VKYITEKVKKKKDGNKRVQLQSESNNDSSGVSGATVIPSRGLTAPASHVPTPE
jgi:hypothetical protein